MISLRLFFIVSFVNWGIVVGSFLDDVCTLPSNPGKPCNKTTVPANVYYFSTTLERCEKFNYFGCEGNDNRFNDSDDCIDSCQTLWYLRQENAPTDEITVKVSDCKLKPEAGVCRALIQMWYYDVDQQKCSLFGWGGCGGNLNRFDTQAECDAFCKNIK